MFHRDRATVKMRTTRKAPSIFDALLQSTLKIMKNGVTIYSQLISLSAILYQFCVVTSLVVLKMAAKKNVQYLRSDTTKLNEIWYDYVDIIVTHQLPGLSLLILVMSAVERMFYLNQCNSLCSPRHIQTIVINSNNFLLEAKNQTNIQDRKRDLVKMTIT